jgi:ABC-type nickel/cobalt efflux system permease component RcnA
MSQSLILFSATSTFAVLGLGFLLGLKHATEADHLAAVSTIAAGRKSLWGSALVGGLWGLGHTISLVAAGILVLFLNVEISERAETALEFAVGIMLTLLGLNVLKKIVNGARVHLHKHEHGPHAHAHPHIHETGAAHEPHTHHGLSLSPRALIVGMIHGMAGSAALMLLVIPTIESKAVGVLYIIIFGIGSIGGMMIMSFLVGLPFTLTALRFDRFNRLLQAAAGMISVGLGLWIVYERGFEGGLFV